jgi:hypothetical protein
LEKHYKERIENGALTFTIKAPGQLHLLSAILAIAIIAGFGVMMLFVIIKSISSLFQGDISGSPLFGFLLFAAFYCATSYYVLRHIRRRLGYRQILVVTSSQMIVIDKSYGYRETRKVNLKDVKYMYIIGTEPFAAIRSEEDRYYRTLYTPADDTIMIDAGKERISLAANLPSWDGDEIIESIEKFIGRTLVPEHHEEPVDLNEMFSRKNPG